MTLFSENLNIFVCPACGNALSAARSEWSCASGKHRFPCQDGIPLLFWPNEWQKEHTSQDVTDIVKAFYEQTPFPNYDDLDSGESLREKARQGVFARLLDEQIPHGPKILEVGCGTGQLTNFLGLTWGRTVFGTDLCLNSLRLANNFKEKNRIANAAFLQMNLFRPVFKPESFDFVVCNGVLHHTSDPRLGFETISKLVRNGGFIAIGLYNTYARLFTDSRRAIFRLTGNRFKFLDPHLRNRSVGNAKKNAWFMDQYKHPHESKHTIGEVIDWFDSSGFEFVNSIPKATAFSSFQENEKLFETNPPGSAFDHFLVQLGMVLTGGREGGFYLMIGRKIASSLAPEAVPAARTARASN